MAKRIFIIDDEPDMVKIGTDLLEAEGYLVSSANKPSVNRLVQLSTHWAT